MNYKNNTFRVANKTTISPTPKSENNIKMMNIISQSVNHMQSTHSYKYGDMNSYLVAQH